MFNMFFLRFGTVTELFTQHEPLFKSDQDFSETIILTKYHENWVKIMAFSSQCFSSIWPSDLFSD